MITIQSHCDDYLAMVFLSFFEYCKMFKIDKRLEENSALLVDLDLSSVYFKNNANFPWVILVPKVEGVSELYQLSHSQQTCLMREITSLSAVINDYFKPDKLNIGTLGNIVSQLHIHIVARFHNDKVWPHSVWQSGLDVLLYQADEFAKHTAALKQRIKKSE